MYVCIIMNFYETGECSYHLLLVDWVEWMLHNAGDLENVLKQQRAKEQSLPENILKKWVGQMVEALAFVHSKKVIHRDLKPSNIFMTTNLDISIGRYSFS